MTRNILDKRLKSLTSELAEMGSLVEKQIYDSIKALKNHDIELSEIVIKNDDKVDALNKRIEEKCLIYRKGTAVLQFFFYFKFKVEQNSKK